MISSITRVRQRSHCAEQELCYGLVVFYELAVHHVLVTPNSRSGCQRVTRFTKEVHLSTSHYPNIMDDASTVP
jgi:hypothetical protein